MPSKYCVSASLNWAVAGAEKILRKEINASAHADMLVALKQDL